MPILTLQRQMHEAGRIRIGDTVPTGNGRTRPRKLQTFRFTSRDQAKVNALANIYGGTVEPWAPERGGPAEQWQVTTEESRLEVIVPPTGLAFSQWLELWSGGGCQRRCDGERETLSDRECICGPEPDERECKPTTRLSVMLARQRGMGLWRLESHGYYAAAELAGAVDVIQAAAGRGHLLPGVLRIDQRSVTRPGQPRRDFAVPVLDVDLPLAAIAQRTSEALGSGVIAPDGPVALPGGAAAELAAGPEAPPFTPVPQDGPGERDPGTVAEQVQRVQGAAARGPKRDGRSAAPVQRAGVAPRTVEQAGQPTPPPDDESEGDAVHDPGEPEQTDGALEAARAAAGEAVAEVQDSEPAHRSKVADDPEDPVQDVRYVARIASDAARYQAVYAAKRMPEAHRRQLMAWAGKAGLDDAGRHAVVHAATGGRTESSKDVTNAERPAVAALVLMVRHGLARVDAGLVLSAVGAAAERPLTTVDLTVSLPALLEAVGAGGDDG